MIRITIDNIPFEVSAKQVLWLKPGGNDFIPAPEDFSRLAYALVLCDYEDVGERTYIDGCPLYEHFIDTHDEDGNEIPSGRDSGLFFPIKSGMPAIRAAKVITGKMNGENIVVVMEWGDPLNEIMTTSEAETELELAPGSIKKACQRKQIPARKSGGTWLVRRNDAYRRWRVVESDLSDVFPELYEDIDEVDIQSGIQHISSKVDRMEKKAIEITAANERLVKEKRFLLRKIEKLEAEIRELKKEK